MARWTSLLVDVPDFPKPGIIFKDITPVLSDPEALKEVFGAMTEPWQGKGITKVIGIESRGFIFAAPIATALDAGLVLVRKPGKLPRKTLSVTYDLEYGTDSLHLHEGDVGPDDRVLIVDDVLATGGTAQATADLVAQTHGEVAGFSFAIELGFLKGRERLGAPVDSLLVLD